MGDLDKKGALREVLRNVRNAHGLIFEYQRRVLNLIKYIKSSINCRSVDIHKFPNEDWSEDLWKLQYAAFAEIFFGSQEDDDYKNVFSIIISTGRDDNAASELIFILDAKSYFLKKTNQKKKEPYFMNIISKNKRVLRELEENGCEIQRRNIEDFYNEEALKKEWKKISNAFSSCWINDYKGTAKVE